MEVNANSVQGNHTELPLSICNEQLKTQHKELLLTLMQQSSACDSFKNKHL